MASAGGGTTASGVETAAAGGAEGAGGAAGGAAVCVTGLLRGVCSPHHVWFLVNRILTAFPPGADLFVVVPAGPDCARASELFPNATELLCVRDRPFSAPEQHWISSGPPLCWNRERYLLQLRLIRRCGALIEDRIAAGARYRWILRARADVLWERFPWADAPKLAAEEAWSDAIQLSWTPMLQWQAAADNFALGRPDQMLKYLAQYDFVLDPLHWPEYNVPGDRVWNRIWAHDCNYPELILERYLFSQRLPFRYSRHFCFSRMRVCGVPEEASCGPREPAALDASGAVRDDLARFRHRVLAGKEVLAEQTFPAHYDHDGVLAAKLVEFFHREQRRLGRPPKIVDLGCGRGTLVQEFRPWRLLAVGIDKNALLTGVIPEVGMVDDVTGNLSFTVRSWHPRCDFEPVFGQYSPGMDFESAEHTGRKRPESPVPTTQEAPMASVHWVHYLIGRCCF
eukprot:TRINITY_DN18096_c0_g1_i1.p1 TRINITY_DN18096_c0_g1~~TRINITY_DN18096_c0_g1_i1.p1  ORF type:complete len:477 (+),score=72.81 TRINITY_DN18096_c0_g1_i1:72-1433(+)